jgi:hypothetical protein
MASSNSSVTKKFETAEEDGVEYVSESSDFGEPSIPTGGSLTRHYEVGQNLSLHLEVAPVNPLMPMVDLLPLNFTITGPNNKQAYVLFWIDPSLRNPTTGYVQLMLSETEWGGEGLIVENTSSTSFVGGIIEDGNYELISEGGALTYVRLTYLALLKNHV